MDHEPDTEDHSNRYRNQSPPPVAIQKFKHANSFQSIVRIFADLRSSVDDCKASNYPRGSSRGVHADRSTLITQVSRSLVLINAIGTTGILIPNALNAARMRAAWIASIHAIPASNSIMYGDFNFAVSLTYPTAAPISSASASLAMLTSLSTLPCPLAM